ncbi:MAG: response regulator [Magnetovibrionaceae bacterium]
MPSLSKVLYVEDDPDIQAVALLALVDVGGLDVKACSSGAEALGAAEAFGPDLILLDVMMPEMDGPETLQHLRKLDGLADTPVIFMTAKVMSDDIERYKSLGAIDVIAKPFDPISLAEQLNTIWSENVG